MSELIADEMRRLKELSGLSFAKLAARTHYSRSSWERFLNGKKPVPREAVEQFASALGEGAESLLRMEGSGRFGESGMFSTSRASAVSAVSKRSSSTGHGGEEHERHRRWIVSVDPFTAGVALGALTMVVAWVLSERWGREGRGGGLRGAYGRCPCASEAPGVSDILARGTPDVPGVPN